jgi:leader peptidase (prepilin peptidase)/N-methyltransferase
VELTEAQEPRPAVAGGAERGILNLVRQLPRRLQLAAGSASVVLAAACFVRFGLSGRAAVGAVFAAVVSLLAAIDLDRRVIPNVIVLPATLAVLVAQIALFPGRTLEWILATLLAALFFFVPTLVYPLGMGMGDVKLAALLGAALGKSVAAALFGALIAGALFALAVLAREGLGARRKAIPYGPFLALGGIVVLLLGGR